MCEMRLHLWNCDALSRVGGEHLLEQVDLTTKRCQKKQVKPMNAFVRCRRLTRSAEKVSGHTKVPFTRAAYRSQCMVASVNGNAPPIMMYRMTPVDHTSTGGPMYGSVVCITSGAAYLKLHSSEFANVRVTQGCELLLAATVSLEHLLLGGDDVAQAEIGDLQHVVLGQ